MKYAANESQRQKTSSIAVRACNIALRTSHIAVASVLAGGHYFGMEPDRLIAWLYMTLLSGAALLAVEAYPDRNWYREARAWMVCAKILLTGLIGWQWNYRLLWLLLIIIIGSVGSHMPKALRHHRVIPGATPTRPAGQ
jgi:hypothetical protein